MLKPGGYVTITVAAPSVVGDPASPEGIELDQRVDANWSTRLRPKWRMRQGDHDRIGVDHMALGTRPIEDYIGQNEHMDSKSVGRENHPNGNNFQ